MGRFTPQERLFGRAYKVLAESKKQSLEYVTDLINVYGAYQRLAIQPDLTSTLETLERTLQAIESIETILQDYVFPVIDWKEKVDLLELKWDDPATVHTEDLDWQAEQILDEQDQASLIAWWLEIHPNDFYNGDLVSAVEEAHYVVIDKAKTFLCLAKMASSIIDNIRPGLEISDPVLWHTAVKYQRIQEEHENITLFQ